MLSSAWIARTVDGVTGPIELAVAAQPDQFEYLDSLGWGYFKLGQLQEARAALRRSLEIEPSDATAPIRRAHLRAVEARLRALEAAPGGPTEPR